VGIVVRGVPHRGVAVSVVMKVCALCVWGIGVLVE
jgi:hypothetical protein